MLKETQFDRTDRLFGEGASALLSAKRVAVFGVGGVGGYAVEALARAGVGEIDLIDHDTVSLSNLNRQIIALHSTVGRLKVDVLRERIADINPACVVRTYPVFFTPENAGDFDFSVYDYVLDAIDTVSGKIELVMRAAAANVKIISAMGAGNKIGTASFEVTDLYRTSVCPLARVMRTELRRRGIKSLKVVYSKEEPRTPHKKAGEESLRKVAPGSVSYMPSAAGLLMAGEVIRDLYYKG